MKAALLELIKVSSRVTQKFKWNIGEEKLYPYSPMDDLINQKPDLMINIAASPFNYNQARTRSEILTKGTKL